MNPRILVLLLLVAASGCTSPVLVRFNDYDIEYERFWSAQFPEGVEIHMDRKTIRVNGDESIRVNGAEVWADEDGVRIGARQFKLASSDRLVVDRAGKVHIEVVPAGSPRADQEPAKTDPDPVAVAGMPNTSSDPSPSSKSREIRTKRTRSEEEAGSQKDTSLWGFLR